MNGSTYRLNVIAAPGHAEVWLDTGLERCDGVLVGAGDTVEEAIESAVDELTDKLVRLTEMREVVRS